jgi:hypothetical protein
MIHSSPACSREKKTTWLQLRTKGHSDLHVFTGTSFEQEVYGQFISTRDDDGPNQYFKKFGSW